MNKSTAHVRIDVYEEHEVYAARQTEQNRLETTLLQMRQRDKLEAVVLEILQEAGLTNVTAISCLTGEPVHTQPMWSATNLKTPLVHRVTVISEKAVRDMIDDVSQNGPNVLLFDEVEFHDGEPE